MPRPDVALKIGAAATRARTSNGNWREPVILFALAVGGWTIWRLSDVLLLAFGAVLIAALTHALAAPLSRRLGRTSALVVSSGSLTAAVAATAWMFGREIARQLAALCLILPGAWGELRAWVGALPAGSYLLDGLERQPQADNLMIQSISFLLKGSASGIATLVIVAFAGLYLAFHPQTYLRGVLRLFPVGARSRSAEVLEACGAALHRWLLGQLFSMLFVGCTIAVALWLLGVPSPLALGVLAGLGQFVPVIGPLMAAIPALIIAGAEAPQMLAGTAAIYLGASQLEANLLTPLLLRQMVELPMAVTLFAVLAMGVLLGPLGVLFATPLAVVAHVLVRRLYVEGVLGDIGLATDTHR